MVTPRPWAKTVEHAVVLAGLAAFLTLLVGTAFRAYFSVVEEHHVVTNAGKSAGEWVRLAVDDAARFGRIRPLYFAFHFARAALFGADPLALHLFTTAVGVATCFLVYAAARRLGADVVSSLVVVTVLALTENEAAVWYLLIPQETFGMLLTAAGAFALVAGASATRSGRWDALGIVCMALAGLTKESFILLIPALLLLRLAARCWLAGEDTLAALRGMRRTLVAGLVVFTVELAIAGSVVVLNPSSYGPQAAGLSLKSFDPRVWLGIALSPPLRAVTNQTAVAALVLVVAACWPGRGGTRWHLARAAVAAIAWLAPQLVLYSHGMTERYLFPALVAPAAVIGAGLAVLWRWGAWPARLAYLAVLLSLLPFVARGLTETSALAGQHTADTRTTEDLVRYAAARVPADQKLLVAADPGTGYGFEAAHAVPVFLKREGSRSPAYLWPVLDLARRTSMHMAVLDDTLAYLARPAAADPRPIGAVLVAAPYGDVGPVPAWLESAPWRGIDIVHRYGALRPSRFRFVERGEIRRMLLVPGPEGPAAPADRPLVIVEPPLRDDVGVNGLLKTPPWGIELAPGALVWLGHGPEHGFGALLWSAKEFQVTVRCDVLVGPARPEPRRTVEMTLRAGDRLLRETRTFEQGAVLSFAGRLAPGRNHLALTVLDAPRAAPRPDGDPRTLMLLLRRVSIAAADGSDGGRPGEGATAR